MQQNSTRISAGTFQNGLALLSGFQLSFCKCRDEHFNSHKCSRSPRIAVKQNTTKFKSEEENEMHFKRNVKSSNR